MLTRTRLGQVVQPTIHQQWYLRGGRRDLICASNWCSPKHAGLQPPQRIWVCLKIVYPYTQWLMIIIPTKWL